MLTGQYMHNHGVRGNTPPTGGYSRLDHTNTLPVWLSEPGYATAHVGKYLNGYGDADPPERPPGWTEWYGLIDPTTYQVYDYRMNRNGVVTQYGHTPADYQTDVIADTAVDVITRRAPKRAPFFLTVAPLAPHREVIGGEYRRSDPPRATGALRRPGPASTAELRRGRRQRQAVAHPGPARASRPTRSTPSPRTIAERPKRS